MHRWPCGAVCSLQHREVWAFLVASLRVAAWGWVSDEIFECWGNVSSSSLTASTTQTGQFHFVL